MALMQFKRIAVGPLPPQPVDVPVVVEPKPVKRTDTLSTGLPVTHHRPPALYNDSDGGNGYKEWRIERSGCTVTTRWGKWGGHLQQNEKVYRNEAEAEAQMQHTRLSKIKKGYRDIP